MPVDYDPKIMLFEFELELDKVLSEGQILRHHGLTLQDVGKTFHQTRVVIEHSARAVKALPVTMVSLQPLKMSPHSLRHAAGVAEMRYSLGVLFDDDTWEVTRQFGQSINPDAVWQRSPNDLVAIEYDVCGYNERQIRRKLNRFQTFNDQIWATTSPTRAATLRRHLNNNGIDPLILQAHWW
jgi:hypothetical protein